MQRKPLPLHPEIRRRLRAPDDMSEAEFFDRWKWKAGFICKPCWELKYCPYGPIVEDYPLLPTTYDEAEEHHLYLMTIVEGGVFPDGKLLSVEQKKMFERELADFRPAEHPVEIPPVISQMACEIFGHICPVMFAAEPFTETKDGRRFGRYIPFRIKARVMRRDNYTCQHCGKHLRDDEVEFDHIIPIAKGGSSEEHNIRLTCYDCNRDKSDKVRI